MVSSIIFIVLFLGASAFFYINAKKVRRNILLGKDISIKDNKGEFVNGCRLVYPLEKDAMRFLNMAANKFFGIFFSWLLGQRFKDTLCGTKVLSRRRYEEIAENRSYFGDFDPFGDFDLIFGAVKLNLKIVDLPIHYKSRDYGATQIRRFQHGMLLLRMCVFAMRKIKFL